MQMSKKSWGWGCKVRVTVLGEGMRDPHSSLWTKKNVEIKKTYIREKATLLSWVIIETSAFLSYRCVAGRESLSRYFVFDSYSCRHFICRHLCCRHFGFDIYTCRRFPCRHFYLSTSLLSTFCVRHFAFDILLSTFSLSTFWHLIMSTMRKTLI
jgi:hypothetical protein